MRPLFRRLSSQLTIRQQLGLVFSTSLVVFAAIAAVFIAKAAEKRIEERLIRQGHNVIAALADSLNRSADMADSDRYSYVFPLLSLPEVAGIAIYSEEGELVFQRGVHVPSVPAAHSPPHSHRQESETHWYFFETIGHQGQAGIAFDKALLSGQSAGIVQSNLTLALALAAVVVILLLLASGQIVGPLRALSAAMDRARRGEHNVRAELTGSRELRTMGQAFNAMMFELHARQEQLLRSRDMALTSARMKGEFASTLSHELRTPMNGIMGMLELLRGTTLDHEQKEYVSVAHGSGQQLLRLIEEALQLAKKGSARHDINVDSYEPRILVDEVGKLLERKAQQKNLPLRREVDADVPAVLTGDAGKIRQVLINLVANAIKFTDHGEIVIRISMDSSGTQVSFAVTDTGAGIPTSAQQQIFEPYVQLQDSIQPGSSGTGLGLSICNELVRAMGGNIGVHSEPGKGSQFWFTLPLRVNIGAEADTPAVVYAGSSEDAPYILVVDDDKSSRMLMTATLKKDGYRVAEASDGAEAVAMCREQMPHVILMDALMPNMDGFTACQEIRAMLPVRLPQILMITGLQDDGTLERALAVGANDFIIKPVNAAALRQRVSRVLHLQQVDHHLHQLSNFDQLTGLPNRTLFMEQAGGRLLDANRQNNQLALLFIDLDRFKAINETRGHEVGDRLLQGFGRRLQETVRSRDIISRLSGDIFTVLLDRVRGVEGAVTAATKVLDAAKQPFDTGNQPAFLSASIGISLYPQNGSSITELMRQGDAAMYRAKSRGGDTYQFYQEGMELEISQELELEIDLRDALEREEFVLHYQPQVALPGGNLIGLEALVRWQHPRRGLVPPLEFIPLAEKTGLISRIDEWVMLEACRQLRRWIDAGLKPVAVAVNVSGGELANAALLSKVERCLSETGVPASLLKLEITEDTLASSSEETTAMLQRLRSLGVTLAIDDFGTGYSSLSYLKAFPVDTLKIDRSFISDLPNDSSSAAIVSGIITLGHNLQLTIVAEGAETAEQRSFLEQADCDVLQGFLVSRPLPAADAMEWIRKAGQAVEMAAHADS